MATARVSLTVQSQSAFPEQGKVLSQTAADASNGNRFTLRPGCVLIANNSGASTRTVTFSYVRRGVVVTQTAVTLLTTEIAIFGPFAAEMTEHASADAATGDVYVTGSHAEVKLAVVDLPNLSNAGL